jgi:hypothetical protein
MKAGVSPGPSRAAASRLPTVKHQRVKWHSRGDYRVAGGPKLVGMPSRKTYASYSIACAFVWAVILAVVAARYPGHLHTFLLVGAGWGIGWTSATIARAVYPPPVRNIHA